MAARRCSVDGINYPADYRFQQCPICDQQTDYIQADVDDDWEDRVAALQEHLEQAVEEPPEILKIEGAHVRVCGEYLCISGDEVYHGGGRGKRDWPLPPLTLLQVGQQTFEVLGFRRDPRREYIVRTFSTTLSADDLERMAGA